ncbi:MAG: chorismate synthase [Planctomycetes bacterium]|nr:chorismate synthase [Planctomycetota bacterium]
MFTSRLRFLTAGESHGPSLTGVLEGMPAGVPLDEARIRQQLQRRQHGYGSGGRMAIETDHAHITGGVMAGHTTGGPISLILDNRDFESWKDRDIKPMTVPRPGHADLTGAVKYGYRELRLSLERASARETAMRVAVGAACRALLAEFGVELGGYVTRIGTIDCADEEPQLDEHRLRARFVAAEGNDVRAAQASSYAAMREEIEAAIEARDTLGGVVEVAAIGVPPGLGSYVQADRRLDARLAGAMLSVPAAKGVEIGAGFATTLRRGTSAQDELRLDGDHIVRSTNRAGGIEGGISNGAPIVLRVAIKPIATTLTSQQSVDLATGEAAQTRYERSDFCQVPRAVPIAEAMLAIVLADALCEKLGGDSLAEMRPRFDALRQLRLEDLQMDAVPWRFGFEA